VSVGSIGTSHLGLTPTPLPRPQSAPAKSDTARADSTLTSQATQGTAASLEGQIRIAREQLNDWVTCVSATTPKGKAEILSLSAQISAAQDQINHLRPTTGTTGADANSSAAPTSVGLDVWA
jgi:hypothetical protein